MVTPTKKDFSVAFLLQENNDYNYPSKSSTIIPTQYWLSGKFHFCYI